jgi:hypothetical protein
MRPRVRVASSAATSSVTRTGPRSVWTVAVGCEREHASAQKSAASSAPVCM